MFKQNLLQKQFEEFGRVLARLMGLRNENKLEAYEKEFFSTFVKYTSLSPEKVESLSLEEFKDEVSKQKNFSLHQQKMLADLLYDKLCFHLEFDEEKKVKALKEKCSFLYSLLNDNTLGSEFNLGIHYRLNFLKNLL